MITSIDLVPSCSYYRRLPFTNSFIKCVLRSLWFLSYRKPNPTPDLREEVEHTFYIEESTDSRANGQVAVTKYLMNEV